MTAVHDSCVFIDNKTMFFINNDVFIVISVSIYVQFHSSKYSEHSQHMEVFGGPVLFFSSHAVTKDA